jgi:hypothetical protein
MFSHNDNNVLPIGKKCATMQEFDDKVKACTDTYLKYGRTEPYYTDKDFDDDVAPYVMLLNYAGSPNKEKIAIVSYYMTNCKLYDHQISDAAAIYDKRIDIYESLANTQAANSAAAVLHGAYSSYAYRSSIDENKVKKHTSFETNIIILTDDVYNELLLSPKYVRFEQHRGHSIIIRHPYGNIKEDYSVLYENPDNTETKFTLGLDLKYLSDENKLPACIRYEGRYASLTVSEAIVVDDDSVLIDTLFPSDKLVIHSERGEPIAQDGHYFIEDIKDGDCLSTYNLLSWNNSQSMDSSISKFPALVERVEKIKDIVNQRYSGVGSISVQYSNRNQISIGYIKSDCFQKMDMSKFSQSEIVQIAYDVLFDKTGKYVHVLTSYEGNSYININDLKDSKFTFVSSSAGYNSYREYVPEGETGMKVTLGKKTIIFTTDKESINELVNAFKKILSEQDFADMYALAILQA